MSHSFNNSRSSTDRLAALSERLYRRTDERRPEGVLSLYEIDERYERQVWSWRLWESKSVEKAR